MWSPRVSRKCVYQQSTAVPMAIDDRAMDDAKFSGWIGQNRIKLIKCEEYRLVLKAKPKCFSSSERNCSRSVVAVVVYLFWMVWTRVAFIRSH